jgi:tetrapyrrole methylase family protein/MazG family protein
LVEGAGTRAQEVTWLSLYEIDRRNSGLLTSLYVPPLPRAGSFERLQATVARLRMPGGCPWDREQTHKSLRDNLLEETYEVLDAIDRGDDEALREELGDLLLQVVLHAQIAVEDGEFTMAEVVSGIDTKLKHRHPHVWGELAVKDAEEVTVNWEALKREEREASGEGRRSLLDGVPTALPALAQAYAYAGRAKRVGFDWPNMEAVVDKVYEELGELTAAETEFEINAEMGDLLFAIANWARWLDIEPESALREANLRFAQRFRAVEAMARERELRLESISTEALDDLWQAAKATEDSKNA